MTNTSLSLILIAGTGRHTSVPSSKSFIQMVVRLYIVKLVTGRGIALVNILNFGPLARLDCFVDLLRIPTALLHLPQSFRNSFGFTPNPRNTNRCIGGYLRGRFSD